MLIWCMGFGFSYAVWLTDSVRFIISAVFAVTFGYRFYDKCIVDLRLLLYDLKKVRSEKVVWTDDCQVVLTDMQNKINQNLKLSLPDLSKPILSRQMLVKSALVEHCCRIEMVACSPVCSSAGNFWINRRDIAPSRENVWVLCGLYKSSPDTY